MRAVRAAKEEEAASSSSSDGSKPPSADSAASSSTADADADPLSRKVQQALSKRIVVLQQCKDAGLAYSVLVELNEALSVGRNELRTLRANYDELYEICESWHMQVDALKAEKARRDGTDEDAVEEAKERGRLANRERDLAAELDALRQKCAASEGEGASLRTSLQAEREKGAGLKKLMQALREDIAKESAARQQDSDKHKAQEVRMQAELRQELESRDKLLASGRERLKAKEAELVELRERVSAMEVAGVSQASATQRAVELSQARADEASKAASEATEEAQKHRERTQWLQAQLDAQTALAEQAQALLHERERKATEHLAAAAAATERADTSLAERDAALAKVRGLEARVAKAEEEREEALKQYLTAAAKEAPPAPAPAPPPKESPRISPAEAELRALRNELDGWKMVAEQAQQMQSRRENELQVANRTIASLRAAAEDKENSRRK